MKRRTYLAMATGTTAAIAGCTAFTDDEETDADADDTGDSDAEPSEDVDADEDEGDDETEDQPDHPDLVGTFDDFEALDEWDVLAGAATADTDRAYVESQSVLLETDDGTDEPDPDETPEDEDEDVDDANTVQIRLRRELDESIDCSEVAPGLALALEDETITAPLIQLIDGDGNRVDYRSTVEGGVELQRRNFGAAHVDGDFDFGDVTTIQIAYLTTADAAGRLWIDDLHFVPRPETGTVLVQFDGGYETHYTRARSVIEEYDLPATAFVPTDRIREEEDHEGNRLTEAQLETLADAGWMIGSHTANARRLTELDDDDEREEQVRGAREWLDEHGYDGDYFSYPGGKYDDASLDLVDEHHDLGFAGRFPAQGYAANPLLWQRVVDPETDQARDMLDLTARVGGITTLTYVQLEDESYEDFQETMEMLAERVEAGDLEIVTPAELDEYVFTEE